MAATTDVVVVGGGLIGLAVAWRARAVGLSVTVADERPGRGASWAAAGMLAPVTEAHYGEESLLRLNLESARRYPGFVAELEELTGADVGYRPAGTLMVARDRDDLAVLDERARYQRELGLEATRLRGRECRRLEPGLAPRVAGGLLVEDDRQVDNRALVDALVTACERTGVRLRRDAVAAVELAGGRVSGVRLRQGGALAASAVVLVAGCWSRQIAGVPPDAAPVRPVKGQLLQLRGPADPALVTRTIRGLDAYLVPRADGRMVVGATVEERGWDTTVTAGAVLELLRAAHELVPGVAELELVETVVGLRPGSPDNSPLLGPAGEDGLVLATGHYRNGVLLAPVTAEAIAQLLVSGQVPELIAPFTPARLAAAQVRA